MPARLTDKQELFCQKYVQTRSDAEAEQYAGFAPTYGKVLRTKPHIKDRIAELLQKYTQDVAISTEWLTREMAYVAAGDITEVRGQSMEDLSQLPERVRKAISQIEFETVVVKDEDGNEEVRQVVKRFRMHGKVEAGRLLAQMLGALQPPGAGSPEDRPAFTGFNLLTTDK